MSLPRPVVSIAASPGAHVLIAAFIGAAVVPLVPAVQDGFQAADFGALNLAVGAGVGAVLRSLALLIPSR